MREDLVQEMKAVAMVLNLRDVTSVEAFAGRLLEEAADILEKYQKEKNV